MVVLKEPDSDRTLPIIIGPAEAEAIVLKFHESQLPRPMSHDLALGLATAFGASIQEVRVTKLEQETFFAAVVITRDGQTKEIDARPSDAIALALRAQVPIYVHTAVREKAKALGVAGWILIQPAWPLRTDFEVPETWVEPLVWPPLPDWVAPETRQRLAAVGRQADRDHRAVGAECSSVGPDLRHGRGGAPTRAHGNALHAGKCREDWSGACLGFRQGLERSHRTHAREERPTEPRRHGMDARDGAAC